MIKKITSGLLGAAATVALVVGLDKMTSEVIILNAGVDTYSITPMVERLTDDGYFMNRLIRTTILINSPGGEVSQLNFLRSALKDTGREVTTKTYGQTASAAADIFLLGKDRLMGEKAEILFHEVRINFLGNAITYTDLKSIAETGALSSTTKLTNLNIPKMLIDMVGLEELKKLVERMTKIHEDHIVFLMDRLDMTRDEVNEKLLIPNVDVTLDRAQALKLKVATGEL